MEKEKFIEELVQFINERKGQKLRGLNSYNIMTVLRKEDAEVGMHSNFIYSLIDINGKHDQGSLFADLFIKHVLKPPLDFGKIIEVIPEDDADGRRIDFTLRSDKCSIGIEMKTRKETKDLDSQMYDYHKKLKEDGKETIIYYLTLDGKKASPRSYNSTHNDDSIKYKRVSFESDILKWLIECKKQVSNITNLNYAIEYYIDVVKMITGQYESPLNEYKDFFLDNKNGKDKFELYAKMDDAKKVEFYNELEQKTILSEKELEEEKESIKSDFKKAKQILLDTFYKHLLSNLLTQNDFLKFYEFRESSDGIGGSSVIMTFKKYYHLRLWIKENGNRFINLSIGINNEFDWDSESSKHSAENKLDLIEEYKTGKRKGILLSNNCEVPKRDAENLFKVYLEDSELMINDSCKKILQKHIDFIKNALEG